MNCFKVNVKIAKNCVLTYPGVAAGGLFLVGGVLGGGGGVHGEAVHPRPSPPSSLTSSSHTAYYSPHTATPQRSSSPHTGTAQSFSGKFLSALSGTAQRIGGKFLSAH
jgi:hypothetical protein